MKFLEHGPDLPPDVLTAHEEGRLVLYCGAGVSIGAGFPTFAGLVERIYSQLNEEVTALEQIAIDQSQFDRALGLLENRMGSGPVRAAVRAALESPSCSNFPIHEALLRLATDRYGASLPRLVTTNFDNLFDQAADSFGTSIQNDYAPALPVPKPSAWRSIVYLHGSLEPREREQLVYTSADFGRAYLTEGWAARFVTTLCHHFTVLFVGYSLEDPVLRYMMDALASERAAGGSFRQAYALAHYAKEASEETTRREWQAKGVEPILYPAPNSDHSGLEGTLVQWAELWTGGLRSRRHLAVTLGVSEPTGLTEEERSQLDWALEDATAYAAFCGLGQQAPLAWLLEIADTLEGRETDQEGLGRWAASHLDSPELIGTFCDLLVSSDSKRRGILTGLRSGVLARLSSDDHGLDQATQNQWLFLLICDPPQSNTVSLNAAGRLGSHTLMFKEQLTLHPIPELVPSFEGGRQLDCRIELGDQLTVGRVRQAFDELSDEQCANLAFFLTELLHQAIEYQRLVGSAHPGYDRSVTYRSSIRPSNQNFGASDWRLLIEFVLRAAEHLDAQQERDRIRGLVSQWLSAGSPLFDRLALHIVGSSDNWTTSEKLEFLR